MKASEYLKEFLSKKKRRHSKEVADIVLKAGGTKQQKRMAMLHDVVEATSKKYRKQVKKEIRDLYGKDVMKAVESLTTKSKGGKKKAQEIADKVYDMDDDVLEVKLADRLSNLRNRNITKKYKKKTKMLLNAAKDRELTPVQKDIIKDIKKVLKEDEDITEEI